MPKSVCASLTSFEAEIANPKSDLEFECNALIKKIIGAVEHSRFENADKLWRQLWQLCAANDITPQGLLGPDMDRLTLLEEILASRNSKLGRFFGSCIPYGNYSQNRVTNSKDGLFTMRNGERYGPAICRTSKGGFCTGGLKGDKFDGHGQISYADGDTYEGNWADGVSVAATSWRAEKKTLAACL